MSEIAVMALDDPASMGTVVFDMVRAHSLILSPRALSGEN